MTTSKPLTADPLLPQSPDAERTVLDAILSGNRQRETLLDRIQPRDFFDRRHAATFAAMQELYRDGKKADLLAVSERLEATGKTEAAGGIAYVAQLCGGAPGHVDVEQAADMVREKASRRALARICETTKSLALEDAQDAADIADRAMEWLSELARESKADDDLGLTLREAAVRLLSEIEKDGGVRIFSDVAKLDETTGGFRAGELVIITGGTGHGKTLLAQQIARRACRDGHHAAYFSGEMFAAHLESRRLAAQAEVSPSKMRRPGTLTDWEWKSLVESASRECSQCRIIDTQKGDLTLGRIRRVSRALKAHSGTALVVVDYDELVEVEGKDEWDQQRTLVYGLKRLAMELECPVILISQLRKALNADDAKQPTLEKLYGSGAKSKHASCVVYVDRPFVRELAGDETAGRIAVLKNRDGRVGIAPVTFNVSSLRFETPIEQREQAAFQTDVKARSAGERVQ